MLRIWRSLATMCRASTISALRDFDRIESWGTSSSSATIPRIRLVSSAILGIVWMELIFGFGRANKTARPVFKSYKSLQTHIALVTRGVACSLSRLGLEELDGSEVAGAILLLAWAGCILVLLTSHWEACAARNRLSGSANPYKILSESAPNRVLR